MDILNKYSKHKKLSNLSIIAISLVVAFWINFFVLNNTDISKNLKTNILESEVKNDLGNIYLENNENNLILKSNKEITNIDNISFSIAYNPENIEILEIIPKLNWEILDISNTPWLSTIILEYTESNTIKASEKILTIKTNKIIDKTENVNIISANFTDKDNNTFELTTSWITY